MKKVRRAPEQQQLMLSQTSELLGWLDRVLPPTLLAQTPQEERSTSLTLWTDADVFTGERFASKRGRLDEVDAEQMTEQEKSAGGAANKRNG